MMHSPFHLRVTRSAALMVSGLVLFSGDAFAIQIQNWTATARIRSGNTTLTQSPSAGSPSAAVDSTGFLEANGIDILPTPPPIDAGAIAEFDLPNGTVGVSTGFDAVANAPDDNRIFDPYAGASATYFDDLTVTSATLPNGTPVDVRFVFDLAFTADATSTIDDAAAAADITSTADGVQGIAPADNRYLSLLETATFIQNGLFQPPHQAEYIISTTVGSTFSFVAVVDAESFGSVRPMGPPGSVVNEASSGWMGAALAFGGEVVAADAQLESGLLAGPFPAASNVGPAASESALPANPFVVPEPGFGSALALGSLLLAIATEARPRSPRAR